MDKDTFAGMGKIAGNDVDFERVVNVWNACSEDLPGGHATKTDALPMAVACVCVLKLEGKSRNDFIANMLALWDAVDLEAIIDQRVTN